MAERGSEGSQVSWYEIENVQVVHDGYATVQLETVRMPDGQQVVREVVVRDDAVAIVPMTDDGHLLLVKQYRAPLQRYLLEVPAGTLDVAGEDPLAAAQRELQEEIGHTAGDLRHLVTFHNSAGWCTEQTHVYLATGVSATGRPEGFVLEHEEADMEVVSLPFPVVRSMVDRGEITDAKTVIGILLATPYLG